MCVIFCKFICEVLVFIWCNRIYTRRHAGLEKESSIAALLMMISKNIWFPLVKPFDTILTFYVYKRKPVAVEIKPVMIETTAGPYFIKLPVVGICYKIFTFMLVDPGRKALHAIGIETGIKKYHHIIQQFIDLFS